MRRKSQVSKSKTKHYKRKLLNLLKCQAQVNSKLIF
jgi:hypothetical protein